MPPVDLRLIATLEGTNCPVHGLAWSPCGNMLLVGDLNGRVSPYDSATGEDRKVEVWWTPTWESLARQVERPLAMWSVDWSPDGTRLAVGTVAYDSTCQGKTFIWEITERPSAE